MDAFNWWFIWTKEVSIVQKLVNDPDGKNVFPTIRELLCFAAMLGYALGKKIKFPEKDRTPQCKT